jgi:hypothetical protein
MAKENKFTKMVKDILGNLKMAWKKDKQSTSGLTVIFMKVDSKMEFFVVKVCLRTATISFTKVNIIMGWEMGKELFMQKMQLIKAHSKMIMLKVKEE